MKLKCILDASSHQSSLYQQAFLFHEFAIEIGEWGGFAFGGYRSNTISLLVNFRQENEIKWKPFGGLIILFRMTSSCGVAHWIRERHLSFHIFFFPWVFGATLTQGVTLGFNRWGTQCLSPIYLLNSTYRGCGYQPSIVWSSPQIVMYLFFVITLWRKYRCYCYFKESKEQRDEVICQSNTAIKQHQSWNLNLGSLISNSGS